jgi:Arc/MetJ family transcription regulator
MRTNIDIDDKLMRDTLKLSGLTTKKAAVEEAMRLYVKIKRQGEIRNLVGKVHWEGDLSEMRANRFPDWS